MSTLKEQGFKAFLFDFFGKSFVSFSGFLITIVLVRLIPPSEFGLVGMAMVFIGMSSAFTDLGFSNALIQKEELRSEHGTSVFYFNCVAAVLIVGIFVTLSGRIAEFFGQPELSLIVTVLSACFIIEALGSVQAAMLRRELRYDVLARSRIASSFLGGVVAIALAFAGNGYWSLVTQILLGAMINTLLIWVSSVWRPSGRISIRALGELWVFGSRMFLANLLESVVTRTDSLVIGKLFPASMLGFYERAKSLSALITQSASNSLMSVLFPVLSKIQSDLPRVKTIVSNLLGLLSFLTFLTVGALYLISYEFVIVLFGDRWSEAAGYFSILLLSSFSYPLSSLLLNVLRSLGKSRLFLRIQVVKKVIVLANLPVLYFFDIATYLYTLIGVTIAGTMINFYAASYVIKEPVVTLVRPVFEQALIAVFSVVLVLAFLETESFGYVLAAVLKLVSFVFLYLLASAVLATSGYRNTKTEVARLVMTAAKGRVTGL